LFVYSSHLGVPLPISLSPALPLPLSLSDPPPLPFSLSLSLSFLLLFLSFFLFLFLFLFLLLLCAGRCNERRKWPTRRRASSTSGRRKTTRATTTGRCEESILKKHPSSSLSLALSFAFFRAWKSLGFCVWRVRVLLFFLFGISRLLCRQQPIIKGGCYAIPTHCPALPAGWRSR
jgi:hypothetical protein